MCDICEPRRPQSSQRYGPGVPARYPVHPVQTVNVALGLGVVIPPHLACVTIAQWFPLMGQFCKGSIAVRGTWWVSPVRSWDNHILATLFPVIPV